MIGLILLAAAETSAAQIECAAALLKPEVRSEFAARFERDSEDALDFLQEAMARDSLEEHVRTSCKGKDASSEQAGRLIGAVGFYEALAASEKLLAQRHSVDASDLDRAWGALSPFERVKFTEVFEADDPRFEILLRFARTARSDLTTADREKSGYDNDNSSSGRLLDDLNAYAVYRNFVENLVPELATPYAAPAAEGTESSQ